MMGKRCLSMLMAIMLVCMTAVAGIDKIHKKGAKAVWEINLPEFNPGTEIPDSLAGSASAVIIAAYRNLDYDYENAVSQARFKRTGSSYTSETVYKSIDRVMVKLLDASAVEYYSEFSFVEKDDYWDGNIRLYEKKTGFGARVFKPDGTVVVTDLAKAFTVAEGKKGDKDKKTKIAIPGLEVGDVLDYFFYKEGRIDEFDPEPEVFVFTQKYPMMHFIAEGIFNPVLTVEMRAFNGAPLPEGFKHDGRNKFTFHAVDLQGLPLARYIREKRQIPFLQLRILNNNSKLRFVPKSARPGGFYCLGAEAYYRDIADYVHRAKFDANVTGRAVKTARRLFEKNPEWSDRQKSDAAFVAMAYHALIDKENYSQVQMAFMYQDVADKLSIGGNRNGVGFINSSSDVPTELITSYTTPQYVTLIGERPYNMSNFLYCAPGEWSPEFQGEEGGCFRIRREDLNMNVFPEKFNVAVTSPNRNTRMERMTLTFNPETSVSELNNSVVATGAFKQKEAGRFNSVKDWIELAENYLGVPDKDRYEVKTFDPVERKKQLDELMADAIGSDMDLKPSEVKEYNFGSRGVMPGDVSFGYDYRAEFADLTFDAGEELGFSIGKLFAGIKRVDGIERDRNFDAFVGFPSNMIRRLTFVVPEGYSISEESVKPLNTSLNNHLGSFMSQASIDENGNLQINVSFQMKTYVVPAAMWTDFLALTDANADFCESGVMLVKN